MTVILLSTTVAARDNRAFDVAFETPAGDPVGSPVKAGEGQNEFTFSGAYPEGVLTISLRAKLPWMCGCAGNLNDFQFVIDDVPGSAQTWSDANPNGRPELIKSFGHRTLTATVTLTGLPPLNSSFGRKSVRVLYKKVAIAKQDFEVFYAATETNYPGAERPDPNGDPGKDPIPPNWFYYYKQSAGGGEYKYGCCKENRSCSTPGGGDSTIWICNEAYDGDVYFITRVVDGQLAIPDASQTQRFYPNFVGVLRHEQEHANHNTSAGKPIDEDEDEISNVREIEIANTDPARPCSAYESALTNRPLLRQLMKQLEAEPEYPGAKCVLNDAEAHAKGLVQEQGTLQTASSSDWANPGSNSAPSTVRVHN